MKKEEKRSSDFWTDYWVKEDNPDVEVTNYVNLDMAGVNWPGGGGALAEAITVVVKVDAIPNLQLTRTAIQKTRKCGPCAFTSARVSITTS